MDFSNGYTLVASFLSWPTDWYILAGIAVLSMVDTLRSGSQRSAAVVLALLATTILYTFISQAVFIGPLISGISFPLAKVVVFGILFAIMLIAALHIISYGIDDGKPLLAILLALATVVLLVLIWIQVPVLQSLWTFSLPIQSIFSESYRLFWALGALGIFAYVRS